MKGKSGKIIRLRGHHISMLAGYYWEGISLEDMSKFPNKEMDFEMEYYLMAIKHKAHYNEEQKERVKSIYSILIKNPKIKIQIVKGLDSICLPDCSMRDKSCSSERGEDPFTLKEYDLEPDNIYDAGTIMDKIKKYPKIEGHKWKNPRGKYLDLDAFFTSEVLTDSNRFS